jgi:hypothetical protein
LVTQIKFIYPAPPLRYQRSPLSNVRYLTWRVFGNSKSSYSLHQWHFSTILSYQNPAALFFTLFSLCDFCILATLKNLHLATLQNELPMYYRVKNMLFLRHQTCLTEERMDITKVKKSLVCFENYLVVEKMVSVETAIGYSRSLSIALRRMKKFKPSYNDVIEHVVWLQKKVTAIRISVIPCWLLSTIWN